MSTAHVGRKPEETGHYRGVSQGKRTEMLVSECQSPCNEGMRWVGPFQRLAAAPTKLRHFAAVLCCSPAPQSTRLPAEAGSEIQWGFGTPDNSGIPNSW